MARIVIVSNRIEVAHDPATTKAHAGRLATAIEAAIRTTGGLWYGWSGEVSRRRLRAPRISESNGVTYATLDLTTADRDDYDGGYTHKTLWPLFHLRPDLTTYDRDSYVGYRRVNAEFARHLPKLLNPDDLVWIHDYHFIPLGDLLRDQGCRQHIGFFFHVPFPPAQLMLTLPQHRDIVQALLGYDLIGFQTRGDLNSFADYIRSVAGGEFKGDGTVHAYNRTSRTGVFPIGVDVGDYTSIVEGRQAQTRYRRSREALGGRDLIVGVDRLDYTKALPERFLAYERMLANYPKRRGKVTYTQITPIARRELSRHRLYRRELERLSGHINGRFGELGWMPLQYINRRYARRDLAGLYRAASVGLVTPFRDGMNLVALEYVAAQSEDDPGVLVLSKFTGAASQLKEAVIVNPHDIEEISDALEFSLRMPLKERRRRWISNMEALRLNDLNAWRDSFLEKLSEPSMRFDAQSSA